MGGEALIGRRGRESGRERPLRNREEGPRGGNCDAEGLELTHEQTASKAGQVDMSACVHYAAEPGRATEGQVQWTPRGTHTKRAE